MQALMEAMRARDLEEIPHVMKHQGGQSFTVLMLQWSDADAMLSARISLQAGDFGSAGPGRTDSGSFVALVKVGVGADWSYSQSL